MTDTADEWMPTDEELAEAAAIPKGSAIAEAQRLIEGKIRPRPERPRERPRVVHIPWVMA
jgi:hypothetical protein